MKTTDFTHEKLEENVFDSDFRWKLAQRIAHSSVLSRATQLREILLYIVRQAILYPETPVRDVDIAQRALGRRGDFNPTDDSIVRVQIAHLRRKLEHYFSNDGKDESTVLSIALGSYEPIFQPRERPAEDHRPEENGGFKQGVAATPVPQAEKVAPVELGDSLWHSLTGKWLFVSLALGCALTAGLGFVVGLRFHVSSQGKQRIEISNPILRMIFPPNATVNIVLADASLVTLQNLIGSDISIAEYLDQHYPDHILARTSDTELRSILHTLTTSRYTSLNDADIAGRCTYWGSQQGANVFVRYARYMHVRDFEQGNFVVVGSRRGNPWVSLFESHLNFYFEQDPQTHLFHFRNRNPRPGELSTYNFATEQGGSNIGYVDVAVLPNLAGNGSVLLINGFSSETNDAASNLIFMKALPPEINRALASLPENSRIEIFLRVRNLDKAQMGWDVVSLRTSAN
jgi:hypothetical protein